MVSPMLEDIGDNILHAKALCVLTARDIETGKSKTSVIPHLKLAETDAQNAIDEMSGDEAKYETSLNLMAQALDEIRDAGACCFDTECPPSVVSSRCTSAKYHCETALLDLPLNADARSAN